MNERIYRKLSTLKKFLCRKLRRITWLFSSEPFSRKFGFEYGTPVDRFYIESFLAENSPLIRGDVLEIAENTYTVKFGSDVGNSHVLHVTAGNPDATLIGNLETGENIPHNAFDCIILTQTLPFIFDKEKVLFHCFQALKEGGTLLLTVPMICPVSTYDAERWGDYWRFTEQGLTLLLKRHFSENSIQITGYGNYYAASRFLAGMPVEELSRRKLLVQDPGYCVILGAAVRKFVRKENR